MYYKVLPVEIGDIVKMGTYIEPNPEENSECVPDDFLRLAYRYNNEFEILAGDTDGTVMLCCKLTGTILWTEVKNIELVRRKDNGNNCKI